MKRNHLNQSFVAVYSTSISLKPGVRLTDGGADERGRVSDVVETLSLDEVGHGRREFLVVSLHVVL